MITSDVRDQLQAVLGDAYTLERELAGGGMARLFTARDARFGREVVVKLLPPEFAGSVSATRFRREIELLGRLYHPRIVPILTVGEEQFLLYYTMPYVAGESLRQRLDREHQLPIADAVRIASEVAEALAYAHGLGIIHRDIKPGNILLSGGSAVVADFGIALAAERSTQRLSVTGSGFTLGTPTYMSPEQAAGERDLDGRSDLYALGCVLYEMLAGEPPFTGPNAQAVIARHVHDPPRPLRTVRREVPEPLERLVLRLLAKAPADRPATAARVVELLERPDRVSALVQRLVPGSTARRLAGAAAVALVAAGAWATHAWTRAREVTRAGDVMLSGGAAAGIDARTPDPRHVAVLYFTPPAGSAEMEAVAHGLTRDLIYTLARVPDLSVLSDFRMRALGDPAVADSQLRAMRVGTVITGELEPLADSLRVQVHMVDPSTGMERHGERVTLPRALVVRLRDSVVQVVAQALLRQLGRDVELRGWRAETRSDDAWRLRQEAQALLETEAALPRTDRNVAASDVLLTQADSLLAHAAALDPRWVEPALGRIAVMLRRSDLAPAGAPSVLAAALRAADLAVSAHPGDARALELRAQVWYHLSSADLGPAGTATQALARAERDLRAATAADPRRASAWNLLSLILRIEGDHAGSAEALQRAIAADVFLRQDVETANRLVYTLLFAGEGDSARAVCLRTRDRGSPGAGIRGCTLAVLGWTGRGLADVRAGWRALAAMERDGPWPRVAGLSPEGRYFMAALLARSGLGDSAQSLLVATRDSLARAGAPSAGFATEAMALLALHEPSRAIDVLAAAVGREPRRAAEVAALPWFTSLADSARFRAILPRARGR